MILKCKGFVLAGLRDSLRLAWKGKKESHSTKSRNPYGDGQGCFLKALRQAADRLPVGATGGGGGHLSSEDRGLSVDDKNSVFKVWDPKIRNQRSKKHVSSHDLVVQSLNF